MIDITNKTFGRLTGIKELRRSKSNKRCWLFKCVCGNKKSILMGSVLYGKTKSCGCLNLENKGRVKDENNISNHPLFHTWKGMLSRCYNPKSISFKHYGAVGITVCDEWRNDFYSFVSDMGLRPSLYHSMERIKNNQGYFKSNCKWATAKEQARNRKNNRIFTVAGVSKSLCEWADENGFRNGDVILSRIKLGWSLENAIKTPLDKSRHGERNIKAKLSNQDVISIRASAEKNSTLSALYNIDISSIRNVRNRVTWKHLP